jgi:hypothetical protein
MKRKCVQCGKEFDLSEGEIKFYKDKGLTLPKRCKECREANKGNKSNTDHKGNTDNKDKEEPVADTGKKTNSGKGARYKFAGIAAAVALLAAGGGAYSYSSSTEGNDTQPSAYEYSTEYEADDEAYEDGSNNGLNAASNDGSNDSAETAGINEMPSGEDVSDAGEPGIQADEASAPVYRFRNNEYLMQHYEKHGKSMGFASAEEYQAAASEVVNDERALHKLEAEDGDDVYYIEETNDFVIVSKRGYIRTYFRPSAGKRYYDRQ